MQSSVVHLQGVPLSKRFALIPLGPPMLAYSSTCKVCTRLHCTRLSRSTLQALISYNAACGSVQLAVDRALQPGEPLSAWCGPQPNSRLLLNVRSPSDVLAHESFRTVWHRGRAQPV